MQITNRVDEEHILLRSARFSFMICIVLLITNLSTVTVIYYLLPLKEIKPYLISIHPNSEQIVHVQPIEKELEGFHLLMEQLVRKYVMLREVIDLQTESNRWTEMYLMSDSNIYKKFEDVMKVENKNSPMLKFYERGIKRDVYILSSQCLSSNNSKLWQVDWEAVDLDQKTLKVTNRQVFVSTITIDTLKNKIKIDLAMLNPTGFTVTNYNVSKRRLKGDFSEKH